MKKTTKTLCTLLGTLLVLLLAYVAVTGLYDNQTETEEVEETVYVTSLDGISALKYSDGTTEMSFAQGDSAWYYEGDNTISLEQSTVEAMISTFQNIVAERMLENPDALEDYGLETPSYTVTITDTNGKEVVLYIGNAVNDDYYATTGEKEVVYTISSSVVTAMEFDVENLKEVEEAEEDTAS